MNNLNLIIGEDNTLVEFYLEELCSSIKIDDTNKIIYDLAEVNIDSIIDEASIISLFSDSKLIIGYNLDISRISDNDMEYMDRYIKNINKNVYIILCTKKVDARLKKYKIFKDNFNIIEANSNKDVEDDFKGYIAKYIEDNGYTIDNRLISYLYDKLGNNISNINNELDKIFLYKDNDKFIDKDTIDLLITDNMDNIIYEFTNAYLDKDYDKTISMYRDFKRDNIGYEYILVSLSNILRQSMIIKLLYNKGNSNLEIAKFIGKKEYYVKKMLDRLYYYNTEDIADRIKNLAQVDLDYKSGLCHYDNLELFLIGK